MVMAVSAKRGGGGNTDDKLRLLLMFAICISLFVMVFRAVGAAGAGGAVGGLLGEEFGSGHEYLVSVRVADGCGGVSATPTATHPHAHRIPPGLDWSRYPTAVPEATARRRDDSIAIAHRAKNRPVAETRAGGAASTALSTIAART